MNQDVTTLLRAWGAGDPEVSEVLFDRIYQQLHALAQHHLGRGATPTISATVLVNEAFLQLAADPKSDWRDRLQFFAFTATVMRRLTIAYARNRGAQKRGAGIHLIAFDDAIQAMGDEGVDVLALDEALTELARIDAMQARIVELRFFAGLSVEETAEHLDMSARSVVRQWGMAKAWLASYLKRDFAASNGAPLSAVRPAFRH